MAKYFLADIKKKTYDKKHEFKTFKQACRINMVAQIYDNEKFFSVVPLEEKVIKKENFKEEKLL